MRMPLLPAVGVALVLASFACDNDPTPTAANPAPTATAAPPPPPPAADAAPRFKPEYSLTISSTDAEPKQYSVIWTAQVNTGGWKMTTEQVLVEDSMGKTSARVYAILEEPGPGEMVTQATETLTGRHDAGNTKIDRAELSIKRVRRGGNDKGLYVVVKQTG